MDSRFKVQVVRKTEEPQLACWMAAHRDYSEELSVLDIPPEYMPKSETEAGEKLIGMILQKGHFGVLEHPHITLECSGFPHNVIVQARTHRVPFTFDVQSQRYTGKRVLELVELYEEVDAFEDLKQEDYEFLFHDVSLKTPQLIEFQNKLEDVFYVRPPGTYRDRQGKNFEISSINYNQSYRSYIGSSYNYYEKVTNYGWSEECARDLLPQGIRQGFFMTTNIRGMMHFLDMRSKADAQIEIQWLCDGLFEQFKVWCPEVADWYEKRRLGKNKLAP